MPRDDGQSSRDASGEGVDEERASVVIAGPSEDVAAICGRLDTAPTWAVVIHAPDGNRQLTTELGMRRLLRHAEDAGKTVAIATRSAALASRARQAGVPVSRRPDDVRWDSGGKVVLRLGPLSLAAPPLGRYIQVGIIVAVAAVAGAALFTVVPSGRVVAYPPVETVTRVITISASEEFDAQDLQTGQVPASRVTGEVTYTLAVPPTGSVQVGVAAASAGLTITNPTSADVVVAAGTAVLGGAELVAFEIGADVLVPANGSATATATAEQPGERYNLPANSLSGWFDEKYRFLAVTNPAPAEGGTSGPRPAPSEADVASLQGLARTLTTSDAVREDLVTARPFDAVFIGTAETTFTFGNPRPPVGTPADVVLLDVTVSVSALAVLQETLEELALGAMTLDGVPGEFIPGTARATETGARQVDASTRAIATELRLQAEFARGITADAIEDAVKGKSTERARSTLLSRYGIEDAEVTVSPGWAPMLPRFGFRLDIELRSHDAESPTPSVPDE